MPGSTGAAKGLREGGKGRDGRRESGQGNTANMHFPVVWSQNDCSNLPNPKYKGTKGTLHMFGVFGVSASH